MNGFEKRLTRLVLEPTTDALTVIQYCAMIDPENWEARAEMVENGTMQILHGEWLEMAEAKLRAALDS